MVDIYINHTKFLRFPEIKGQDINFKLEEKMADTQFIAGLTLEQAKSVSEELVGTIANTDWTELTDEEIEAIILSALELDIA